MLFLDRNLGTLLPVENVPVCCEFFHFEVSPTLPFFPRPPCTPLRECAWCNLLKGDARALTGGFSPLGVCFAGCLPPWWINNSQRRRGVPLFGRAAGETGCAAVPADGWWLLVAPGEHNHLQQPLAGETPLADLRPPANRLINTPFCLNKALTRALHAWHFGMSRAWNADLSVSPDSFENKANLLMTFDINDFFLLKKRCFV